jgi:hypothetical protein
MAQRTTTRLHPNPTLVPEELKARTVPNPLERRTEGDRIRDARLLLGSVSNALADAKARDSSGQDPNVVGDLAHAGRFLAKADAQLATLGKVAPTNLEEVKGLRAKYAALVNEYQDLGGVLEGQ